MKAYFCSEERFVIVTICYSSQEKKRLIEAAIRELQEKYELEPDMFSFADNANGKGELNIEFDDDYNEEAKPFLEELCAKLDLTFEQACNPSCDV